MKAMELAGIMRSTNRLEEINNRQVTFNKVMFVEGLAILNRDCNYRYEENVEISLDTLLDHPNNQVVVLDNRKLEIVYDFNITNRKDYGVLFDTLILHSRSIDEEMFNISKTKNKIANGLNLWITELMSFNENYTVKVHSNLTQIEIVNLVNQTSVVVSFDELEISGNLTIDDNLENISNLNRLYRCFEITSARKNMLVSRIQELKKIVELSNKLTF